MARKRKRTKNYIKEFNKENVHLNQSSRKLFRRIRDGVENGESGASMLRRFRDSGLHIGNGEFYKTVRLAKAYRQSGDKVRRARFDTILDNSVIPIVPEHLIMRGNYQYIVKLTANDSDDIDEFGNLKTTYLTVRSAQGITRRNINQITSQIVESQKGRNRERYEFIGDDFKIEIVEAYRRI